MGNLRGEGIRIVRNSEGMDGRGLNSGRDTVFLSSTVPSSYPIGIGGSIPGERLPGREADYSPPFVAEVKNGGAISPLPHIPSWHIAELIKHRAKFCFFFFLLLPKQISLSKCSFMLASYWTPSVVWSAADIDLLDVSCVASTPVFD
jgi:hypothetical protein